MKSINIIYLFVCLVLIGCAKDSNFAGGDGETNGSSVVITMGLYSGGMTSRASSAYASQDGVLGDAEYTIDRLRVYVFASDGSLDKMEMYDNLNADHLIEKEIEVPKDLSKELYFVANEPEAVSDDLDDVTSAAELEQVTFTISEGLNGGFNGAATFSNGDFLIPMSAKYSVRNAMSDISVYVGLTRAVARVDLYLRKGASVASRVVELNAETSLSASGVTSDSKFLEVSVDEASDFKSLEGVASSDITLSTSSYDRVLSFYTSERNYSLSSNPIAIGVDALLEGGAKIDKKSVTLGDAGTLSQINRNHVYRIYATYNGTELVADDFDVMEWDDVDIDAEIEGVMVAVDSEVAMDWLRNGNSYASKSISFGSNKPISFYLPVIVTSEDDTTPDYEFELFEFGDMSAGNSYNLKDIALTNNYIYATSWIESATINFTSPKSGYITFVYTPKRVSRNVQGYPIRIKSDNVTKQMMAVYDNGYLPSTLLSDDWAERAPGGVIFAKRGEAKHPVSTPEVLYQDKDGYYRGEYQATAAEGAKYCKETFGEDWYMPSYADMKEIAEMFDMLGVSYRFQNSANAGFVESRYWTSSASSEQEGYYWSADFMSRDYMIENLMERRDGSQSHFVRCVKDLK